MRLLPIVLAVSGWAWSASFDPAGAESLAPATPSPSRSAPAVPVPAAAPQRTDSVLHPASDSAPAAAAVTDSVHPLVPLAATAPVPLLVEAPAPPRDSAKPPLRPVRTIAIAMDTVGAGRTGRSTWTAVGLSLLLPGSGHRYLGHRAGAAIWMTADLLTWSTLAVAWQMGGLYRTDATEIANRYAGAALDADADPALLETMRDWRSRRPVSGRRDSYDENLLQQGLAPDSRYPEDAAHDWDWGSPENPENNRHIAAFEDALRGYRASRVVLTYAAGALLVSRAIAVADILRIRRSSASRAGLQAAVVPGPDGASALVAYRF